MSQKRKTHILGVSAYYHDSAASLLRDGQIVAAAQEERFTRKKFDARFPRHAIRYCLQEGGISLADLKYFVFYDKPLIKFERLVRNLRGFLSKRHQILSRRDACLAQGEAAAEERLKG
jgi:carbamoyltransferase